MGEEFYSIIKLVSGEEIFSLVSVDENDGDTILILHNPVEMKLVQNYGSSFVKIKPWMEITDEDLFIIKLDKVITMTETTDEKIIGIYRKYLSSDPSDFESETTTSGQVKVSDEMGYVSSVDDARKKLERIFKGLKES